MRLPTIATLVLVAAPVTAADPAAEYRKLSPAELEARFLAGDAVMPPAGAYRGRVVWVDDARLPRVRGAMQSAVWKGKKFHDDGTFTNRFPGFTALPSSGRCDLSWLDGRPAWVLDYPENYPLFGSNRDEVRRVGCGVWLGRVWDRRTGCAIGWFVLAEK